MKREPNTVYVLSLSYGKDSLACLDAIQKLGYPLDRIIHAEVWATKDIPADLPPMVEFKRKADEIILQRYGIVVEHFCATKRRERERESGLPTQTCSTNRITTSSTENTLTDSHEPSAVGVIDSNTIEKLTYEDIFYRPVQKRNTERERESRIYGFPILKGNWCTSNLKQQALRQGGVSIAQGNSKNNPLRISNLSIPGELVYETQTTGFRVAPLHKVQIQILCSISVLLPMNPKG